MRWIDPVLGHTAWTPLARYGHAWPTHHLVVKADEGWAVLRPNLPHNRPLLVVSEASGIGWMVWQIAQKIQAPDGGQRFGLAWLMILLIAMSLIALTLRSVVLITD